MYMTSEIQDIINVLGSVGESVATKTKAVMKLEELYKQAYAAPSFKNHGLQELLLIDGLIQDIRWAIEEGDDEAAREASRELQETVEAFGGIQFVSDGGKLSSLKDPKWLCVTE